MVNFILLQELNDQIILIKELNDQSLVQPHFPHIIHIQYSFSQVSIITPRSNQSTKFGESYQTWREM